MRPSREQNIQNITDLEKQKHEDFEEGLAEEETDLDANKQNSDNERPDDPVDEGIETRRNHCLANSCHNSGSLFTNYCQRHVICGLDR